MKKLLPALLALTIAGGALAQAKPEDAIRYRQAGYAFMSWNMGKLKGMLVDNPASFNKEANELAKVAASGDAAALKVQFGKVGETCKGCHDKFRKDDK